MVAAVAIIAAVSCNKEFSNDNLLGGSVITFRASINGDDTKAQLVGGKSQWEANDAITVLNGTSDFKFTTSDTGSSVNFTYNNQNHDFTGSEFVAVYPASAGFPYSVDFGSKTINAHIPTWQEAKVDSYSKNAALSVAYTQTDELYFMNAVALLKFTVSNSDIKSVTFCGNNSDVISGNVQVNLDETGKSVKSVEGQPTSIFGFATEDNKVYLCPNNDWKSNNARFAAYFFGNGETWVDMKKSSLKDDIYEVVIPTDKAYTHVILCRMNPSATANNWDNKWNQSQDLDLHNGILYTVTGWDNEGKWEADQKNNETFVELYANGDALEVGKTYYMAVAPKKYEKGFYVQLQKTGDDKKTTIATKTTPFEIKPSTIINLGNLTYPKDRDLKFASSSVSVLLNEDFVEPELTGETEGVTYSSSDHSVATVDASTGVVTIVGVGTTTITASALATMGYSAGEASYTLTVTKKKDRGLKFSSDKASLINGLGTSSTLSGITDGVKYLSDDNSVATVDATTGAVTMVSPGVVTITAIASETEEYEAGEASYTLSLNMLYLEPNSNWTQANARFAAYFFGNGETWVSMTKTSDGYYQVPVPKDKIYPNIIFCRMNPSAPANNWNNKWNQTGDLVIPTDGKNLFTLPNSSWDGATATWSVKP